MNSITKFCKRCSTEKQIDEFFRDKSKKDGLTIYCKKCHTKICVETRDKSKNNKRAKIYRDKNKDKIKEINKIWYKKTIQKDPTYYIRRVKIWASNNKDKVREQSKRKYKKDPQKSIARARAWEKNNPEKFRETRRIWNKNNPDKGRRDARNRRARKKNSIGKIEKGDWNKILDLYEHKCLCCGSTEDLTLDHVIPLVCGGSNTIENSQPLCRSCNSKKGTKTIDYRPFHFYEK